MKNVGNQVMKEGLRKEWQQQIDKIRRHRRKHSFGTKRDYDNKFSVFADYMCTYHDVKKIANISNKHLKQYIEFSLNSGKSISTLKTELSAIRSFHAEVSNPKHELTRNNNELLLGRREIKGKCRRWTETEIQGLIRYARDRQRADVVGAAILAKNMGLRIHEVFKLDTNRVQKELTVFKEYGVNKLNVKGKNGKWREVIVNEEAEVELRRALRIAKDQKWVKLYFDFEDEENNTTKQIKSIQNFIYNNREKFEDVGDNERTEKSFGFHGIRHYYAHEEFKKQLVKGKTKKEANLYVSRLLGHERDEITDTYTS